MLACGYLGADANRSLVQEFKRSGVLAGTLISLGRQWAGTRRRPPSLSQTCYLTGLDMASCTL